ncbi:MAG TPA: hypothetical protein ENN03_02070 [bacterium]|nr:hypothetical protein [bacterium]
MKTEPEMPLTERKIIAVGGGKGGIGKSVIAASLGAGLARLNHHAAVVDADLGGSNLHTIFGIEKPEYTLSDFLDGKKPLQTLLRPHPDMETLSVLCGASGVYGISNLAYRQKQKMISRLRRVDTEYLILDLGAGTGYNVLDLFLLADHGIILVNPDPLSVLEGYNFLRQAFYRGLIQKLKKREKALAEVRRNAGSETFRDHLTVDGLRKKIGRFDPEAARIIGDLCKGFKPMLLINKWEKPEDETSGLAVKVAAGELLSVDVEYLGRVRFDRTVSRSVESGRPFIYSDPKSPASRDLADIIIVRILNRGKIRTLLDKQALRGKKQRAVPIDANTVICSVRCLYWEECAYREGGMPCKMQHLLSIGGFQERT